MRDRRAAVEMQFDQALGREPRERPAHEVRLTPKRLPIRSSGSLVPGLSACSMIARRNPR